MESSESSTSNTQNVKLAGALLAYKYDFYILVQVIYFFFKVYKEYKKERWKRRHGVIKTTKC